MNKPTRLVSVVVEASAGLGKTALATVIEKTLRDAGVDVLRQPTEEMDSIKYEDALGVLGEMTGRNIQVGLSERHVRNSGYGDDYEKLVTLDNQQPGYFRLWHDGRPFLQCEPQTTDGLGNWKPVFLDDPCKPSNTRFTLMFVENMARPELIARFPVDQFADVIRTAHDYVLVWMQRQQIDPMKATLTRDQATLLRRRCYELLSQVMRNYVTDTSVVDSMYPNVVRVDLPKNETKVVEEPVGPKKIKITVEGPGNSGKVAMALLIAKMLNDIGVPATRTKFDAPAPLVIGMDDDECVKILRNLGKEIDVEVINRDLPRG